MAVPPCNRVQNSKGGFTSNIPINLGGCNEFQQVFLHNLAQESFDVYVFHHKILCRVESLLHCQVL